MSVKWGHTVTYAAHFLNANDTVNVARWWLCLGATVVFWLVISPHSTTVTPQSPFAWCCRVFVSLTAVAKVSSSSTDVCAPRRRSRSARTNKHPHLCFYCQSCFSLFCRWVDFCGLSHISRSSVKMKSPEFLTRAGQAFVLFCDRPQGRASYLF